MKLIDKIYKTLSHQVIWGPDGIMPLKKFKANSGGFTASCPNPAHEDNNPSFLMKEGLPTGKCQSCGYSLRWFDAIALSLGHKTTVKGKDYWKVIETLSNLNGGYHYELTTEEKERYELMHEIQELRNTLSRYLHQQLLENPWAEHTRQYLEKRGIEKKYLSKLPMIGFYPQTETVEQFLISKKFSLEAIQEANVLFKYFQNQCLIFSYKDELGNTLGFKGRKPNTKVIRYQKGFKGEARNQAIMGLESCNAILENKHRIICVEGEFDWLRTQAEALKLQDGTAELVCLAISV